MLGVRGDITSLKFAVREICIEFER